jgi:hypothetical protein
MAITRLTAQWGGFRGAPGYSNFFFDGALSTEGAVEAAAVAVRGFFQAINGELPTGSTISIVATADILDEASGQITSVIDFAAPSTVTGSGGGPYSAASGAVVNWNTQDYVNGRRVRGRTFLVPLAGAAYDSQGDLASDTLTVLRLAADNLVGATLDAPLAVWHRPVGGAGGSSHVINSASVPDLGAVLRSRRD